MYTERDGETLNLVIERDAGNEIMILMSRDPERCLDAWKKLRKLCDDAISEMEWA